MAVSTEDRRQIEAEWEARQSPVGFFNLALSYLETADVMTARIHALPSEDRPKLVFDSPVRHLYAQTWELTLKACLFAQGVRPIKLKNDFGHKILRAYKHVDKIRFGKFNFTPESEKVALHLDYFHSERMFSYPMTGIREYLPLSLLKTESQRFRLDRPSIIELFL